jgi:hypothetical protein
MAKTVHIEDTSSEGKALLSYLSTLKFVRIDNNEQTPTWHKELIKNRLNELKEEDLTPWEEVKQRLNKKYEV